MKLILIPLSFLVVFAFLAQMGLAHSDYQTSYLDTVLASGNPTFTASTAGWYDINGHQVCDNHEKSIDDIGCFYINSGYIYWQNGTTFETRENGHSTNYPIFNLAVGEKLSDAVAQEDEIQGTSMININSTGFWALVGIITAVMALATVAGFHFLSSGESEISILVIVTGVFFMSIWGFLAVLAYPLISTIPLFLGYGFFFAISLSYIVGIVGQFSGTGDGL